MFTSWYRCPSNLPTFLFLLLKLLNWKLTNDGIYNGIIYHNTLYITVYIHRSFFLAAKGIVGIVGAFPPRGYEDDLKSAAGEIFLK